ncbi:MAG: histone deacetylase family protein [Fimbriimonadaceae bacterium]|nr:histone deacetylase family protein [Alphaproteobacteria bacterium]
MTTLYIHHDDYLGHDVGRGHPERPERLIAIERVLAGEAFRRLKREEPPLGTIEQIRLAHTEGHVRVIEAVRPAQGIAHIDADTAMSPGSWQAALRAVGGIVSAVEQVVAREVSNAFCAVRPPGHHAEANRPMGFCLFNNAAIGALYARQTLGLDRVAIVDFDVHHGNGTQDIFWSNKNMFYGSTHQMPLFPGTGALHDTGVGNIFNAPLYPHVNGEVFRDAMRSRILPALDAFSPDLIIVSAGFDAHHDDPLANIDLTEQDFEWITNKLLDAADRHTGGRLVSVLEGGYDLGALARSAGVHVSALMSA